MTQKNWIVFREVSKRLHNLCLSSGGFILKTFKKLQKIVKKYETRGETVFSYEQ